MNSCRVKTNLTIILIENLNSQRREKNSLPAPRSSFFPLFLSTLSNFYLSCSFLFLHVLFLRILFFPPFPISICLVSHVVCCDFWNISQQTHDLHLHVCIHMTAPVPTHVLHILMHVYTMMHTYKHPHADPHKCSILLP